MEKSFERLQSHTARRAGMLLAVALIALVSLIGLFLLGAFLASRLRREVVFLAAFEMGNYAAPADNRASRQSRRSREQVPNTLGIRLMTREHLLRYAGDKECQDGWERSCCSIRLHCELER